MRGFETKAIVLSGNLKLYCARNRLPVWDGTTASGYDAAAEEGDTLTIEVTNTSMPIYTDFSIYYFMLVNEDGGLCFLRTNWLRTPDAIEETLLPAELSLRAYPNPFNAACHIDVPHGYTAAIYDIHGRHVHALPEGSSIWNAEGQPSGVYLVRASKGTEILEKRVVLVK